eukprot:767945-Hanusia_phi.AAC.2
MYSLEIPIMHEYCPCHESNDIAGCKLDSSLISRLLENSHPSISGVGSDLSSYIFYPNLLIIKQMTLNTAFGFIFSLHTATDIIACLPVSPSILCTAYIRRRNDNLPTPSVKYILPYPCRTTPDS